MQEKLVGHHSTSLRIAEAIVRGDSKFLSNKTEADWLGTGIYFWFDNVPRAREWKKNTIREKRAVIECVIDMGNSLNINNHHHQEYLKDAYRFLTMRVMDENFILEENIDNAAGKPIEKRLDCQVIDTVHYLRRMRREPQFDTVYSVFTSGEPIHPGSSFQKNSHLQICVLTLGSIAESKIVWIGD